MKKIFAIMLALVLMLSVAASAEVGIYVLAAVQDAEGNVIMSEEFPVLVFSLDDETNACALGTEDEMIEGTYEIVEATEETLVLAVTLNDGSEVALYYTFADDVFAIMDEENGYVMVLMNYEVLAELAA